MSEHPPDVVLVLTVRDGEFEDTELGWQNDGS
jgi:hypothetical protein